MRTLILAITALLLLFSGSSSYAAPQHLVFATDASYPPFENTDYSTGNLIGYDIDLAKALCNQMGVQCGFVNVPFPELLNGLNAGKYDAVIRSLSITPERQKLVDFTNPYFATNGSFVAAASSNLNASPQTLRNKTIGVQEGTTFQKYLKAKYSNIAYIRTYEYIEEALHDLTLHNVDVVLGDKPVIEAWVQQQPNNAYQVIGETTYDKSIFGSGFGIAVKKGNTELLNALNKALAVIKSNGVYQKVTEDYFGSQ